MKRKECKKARNWFSLYFDEELGPEDSSKLVQHFAVCDSCKTAYESYKTLFSRVRSVPSVEASDSFETRLHARIRSEGTKGTRRSSWWQDFSRIPLPVPVGAAALLLIGLFSYTRLVSDPSTPEVLLEGPPLPTISDTAGLRDNTLPSWTEGFRPATGDLGHRAAALDEGPRAPAAERPTIRFVAPRDMNGVPLEGPYLPNHARPAAGGAERTGGVVDTFSVR